MMPFESLEKVFHQKLSAILERDPRAIARVLLIKEVMITNGILAHILTPPNSDTRAEILVSGTACSGAEINSGRIVFQGADIAGVRPTFDTVRGEVRIQAPASQIAAYVACLRSSKQIFLVYVESPSIDDVSAYFYTYDVL